jgi:hypothetical protein
MHRAGAAIFGSPFSSAQRPFSGLRERIGFSPGSGCMAAFIAWWRARFVFGVLQNCQPKDPYPRMPFLDAIQMLKALYPNGNLD